MIAPIVSKARFRVRLDRLGDSGHDSGFDVSTCAKAFVLSLIIAVLTANLSKVQEFLLCLTHAALKD